MASEEAVSSAAKGAWTLMILQIATRALTFALNQVLLRFLSPELLGASVQLEIFKIGIQYFSRESLRVAAERRSHGGIQAAVNLSYLAILANVPLGFAFAQWYQGTNLMGQIPRFREALRVNQLAAFLELLMEPAYTATRQNMLYGVQGLAEGSSVILKTVTVFSLYFWAHKQGRDLGVLPFAVGEIANSITLVAVYWASTIPKAREQGFSLLPKKIQSSPDVKYLLSLFSKPLLYLVASLFLQTGIKWLLTEGDRMLILPLATLQEQGVYALAANYGGLVARMVFQPVENSSRNLFASLCSTSASTDAEQYNLKVNGSASTKEKTKSNPNADSKANVEQTNIATAVSMLKDLLHVYAIMSTICLVLGPTLAPLLLRLVAGSRWTAGDAGSVLGAYTIYIPFLAINGVSEAFVAATASTKDLRNQTIWMAGFSVLLGASAWFFVVMLEGGARGFIWANCVNMALRITFNLYYVKGYFGERGQDFSIAGILPSSSAIAATVAGLGISQSTFRVDAIDKLALPYGLIGEVIRAGAAGSVFVATIAASEWRFLLECWNKFRPQKKSETKKGK